MGMLNEVVGRRSILIARCGVDRCGPLWGCVETIFYETDFARRNGDELRCCNKATLGGITGMVRALDHQEFNVRWIYVGTVSHNHLELSVRDMKLDFSISPLMHPQKEPPCCLGKKKISALAAE